MEHGDEAEVLKGAQAAANAAGLNRRDIYYLVQLDRIPHRKVGRLLYFNREELLDALQP